MRSRGTFLPRKTFSRNGITSSIPSGPPKDTTNNASQSVFMHHLDQRDHVLDRRLRQDPVTKIKDVSRPATGLIQNPLRLFAQRILFRKQRDRIEIPHHRDVVTDSSPAF